MPTAPFIPARGLTGMNNTATLTGCAAIVHDWLLGMRGGEWLLVPLLKLLPDATLHTLFYRPDRLQSPLRERSAAVSWLNTLPAVEQYYRWLLPLMPSAVERLKISPDSRLILKTSHCVAHGARGPLTAGQRIPEIHYYFSPMRFLYDQAGAYASG